MGGADSTYFSPKSGADSTYKGGADSTGITFFCTNFIHRNVDNFEAISRQSTPPKPPPRARRRGFRVLLASQQGGRLPSPVIAVVA
jgi:hypothetical protein